MTIFTGLLVVVGFLTVFLMGYQSIQNSQVIEATSEANKIANETLAASQRAWLSPDSIEAVGDANSDGSFTFYVFYNNVGREPATNVRYDFSFSASKSRTKKPSGKVACGIPEVEGAGYVAYPSENTTYRAIFTIRAMNDPIKKPSELIPSLHTIFIQGCLNYMSFGAPHHSGFCFFMRPSKDKIPKDWPWQFCSEGNDGT